MSRPNRNPVEVSEQTGFQSACAEYAEQRLSLDEKFDGFNPGLLKIELSVDVPQFDLKKGDLLLVLKGQKPRHGQLVLASFNGEMSVHKFIKGPTGPSLVPSNHSCEQLDDLISGVIHSFHRKLAEPSQPMIFRPDSSILKKA